MKEPIENQIVSVSKVGRTIISSMKKNWFDIRKNEKSQYDFSVVITFGVLSLLVQYSFFSTYIQVPPDDICSCINLSLPALSFHAEGGHFLLKNRKKNLSEKLLQNRFEYWKEESYHHQRGPPGRYNFTLYNFTIYNYLSLQ